MFWHTARMPDEDQRSRNPQVRVVVSKDAVAERLAQLPTRKEMYRAVLFGVTTGACLVQCLAWLFR
jgi:uncharacterized membrane-anchored protein